jgi:hypothetical protein
MTAAEAGMEMLIRGPADLLGEDLLGDDAGWEEIYDLMREPMDEDLLAPIAVAAALPASVPVAAGRPPKGAKRMTAYGYPTWREVAPEPYVPRPTRTRGKGLGVPEASRKRVCIDLSAELTDGDEEWGDGTVTEVESEGEFYSSGRVVDGVPQWRWGAEFVVRPNNGWVEVVEVY